MTPAGGCAAAVTQTIPEHSAWRGPPGFSYLPAADRLHGGTQITYVPNTHARTQTAHKTHDNFSYKNVYKLRFPGDTAAGALRRPANPI